MLPEDQSASPDEAQAIADLLGRLSGAAAVHMYEMELFDDQRYVCNVWIGAALESLLGGVPEGMDAEEAWEACVHPDDRPAYHATLTRLTEGVPTDMEYRLVGFDGVTRWVWERCRPRDLKDGRRLVDGIVTDVSERHLVQEQLAAARDRLSHLAYHDPLTELPNRLLFQEHLDVAIGRARREHLHVAVLFIDLDGFKSVNDLHGHAAGDALLREVGGRLRGVGRGADVTARLGGDEFLMLAVLEDSAAPRESAAALADRVRSLLAPPVVIAHGVTLNPSASIGVGIHPLDADDAEELVRAADAAMYRDKTARKAA